MEMSEEVVAIPPSNSSLTSTPPHTSSAILSSFSSLSDNDSMSATSTFSKESFSINPDGSSALYQSATSLMELSSHASAAPPPPAPSAASSAAPAADTFSITDRVSVYQEKEMNDVVMPPSKLSNTSNLHLDRLQSLLSSQCPPPSSSSFYSPISPAVFSSSSSCLSGCRCISCCRSGFYLSVAVGGRRNYLFQDDNITPAGNPDSAITRAMKEERLKAEAEAEEAKSKRRDGIEPKSARGPKVLPTTPTVTSQPQTARSAASSCASVSEDSLEEENGMDEPTSPLSASSNSSLSSTDAPSHRTAPDDTTDEMDLTSSPQSSLQSLPSQTQTQEMSPSLLPHSSPHSFSSPAANPLTLSPSTTREKRRKKMRADSAAGGTSSPEESEEENEAQSPLDTAEDIEKKQNVLRRQTTRHTVQQRREKTLLALRAAAQDRLHDGLASPSSARFADDFTVELQTGERIKIQEYSGMPLHVASGYGQDAFYVAADESIHSETSEPVLLLSLGVADGVGGWRSTGVDSGKMAQAMMKNCLQMVHDRMTKSSQYVAATYAPGASNCQDDILYSPADMMARAYYDIQQRRSVDAGSTTACVVHLLPNCLYESLINRRTQQQLAQEPGAHDAQANHTKGSENPMGSSPSKPEAAASPTASLAASGSAGVPPAGTLHSHNANGCTMLCANLGDSGFTVYRNSSVVVQCEYQRDETGVVKQLAMIPEAIAKTPEAFEYCQDSPTEASISNHRVSVNDIIILASDGLWDNLCEPLVAFSHPFAGLLRVKANLDVNAVSRTRRMQKVIRKLIKSAMKEEELANRQRFDEKSHVGESIAECKEAEEDSDEDDDDNASDEAIHQREFQAFSCGKEVDVRRICAALVKHAADYMRTFEGKPDDLTVMVAQLRRHVPEPCSCACHQMK